MSSKSLKKICIENLSLDTPIVEKSKLDEDPQGKVVDPTRYRGMIGTLMYLISSRPDLIMTMLVAKIPDESLETASYAILDAVTTHQVTASLISRRRQLTPTQMQI
ncbi:hypothetical protein Tco_1126581 [Tanacetum coccineum]